MSVFISNSRVINLTKKISYIGSAGFVRLVDVMPRVIPEGCKSLMCDHAIVQAARVSLNEAFLSSSLDSK